MPVCMISRAPLPAGGQTQIRKLCLVWPSRGLSLFWWLGNGRRLHGRGAGAGKGVGDASVLQIQRPGSRGLSLLKPSGEGCTASPYPSQAGLGWPQPRPRGPPPNDPTLPRSCSAKTIEGSVCDLVKAKSCWGMMRTPCPALPTLLSLLGQKG